MMQLTGTKQEVVALGTFVKLMRATESVSADVHRELGAEGLTISQFGVLEALYHLGPMFQKDIAQKILKSAGNITLVIDNLEKRDLVVRKRSDEDRRYYQVRLTKNGESLIAYMFPSHKQRITKRMSMLSLPEQRTLADLLRKLGQYR